MPATTVLRGGSVAVTDYRCDAAAGARPFVEVHGGFTLA
jgi:hypothetical protein